MQLFDSVHGDPSTQRYLSENERQSAVFYDSNAAMQDELLSAPTQSYIATSYGSTVVEPIKLAPREAFQIL